LIAPCWLKDFDHRQTKTIADQLQAQTLATTLSQAQAKWADLATR
jgi:hypothetical protein